MADKKEFTAIEAVREIGKDLRSRLKAVPLEKAEDALVKKTEYTAQEASVELRKAIQDRVKAFEHVLVELRKKEGLSKGMEQVPPHGEPGIHEPSGAFHSEPGAHEKLAVSTPDPVAGNPFAGAPVVPAGNWPADKLQRPEDQPAQAGPVDPCPMCGQEDQPGSCTCLGMMKAESDKYTHYLVDGSGKIQGGYEYKEDAQDAAKEQSDVKVKHHSKVDAGAKEEFHRSNKIMGKMHKAEPCAKCGSKMCKCMSKNATAGYAGQPSPGSLAMAEVPGTKMPTTTKPITSGIDDGSGGDIEKNKHAISKAILPPNSPKQQMGAAAGVMPTSLPKIKTPPKMGSASGGAGAMKPPAPPGAPGMKGSTQGTKIQKSEPLEKFVAPGTPGDPAMPATHALAGMQQFQQGYNIGRQGPVTAGLTIAAVGEQQAAIPGDIASHAARLNAMGKKKPAVSPAVITPPPAAPAAAPPMVKEEKPGDTHLCNHHDCHATIDSDREYCTSHTKGSGGKDGFAVEKSGLPPNQMEKSGLPVEKSGLPPNQMEKSGLPPNMQKAMPAPAYNAAGMKQAMMHDPKSVPAVDAPPPPMAASKMPSPVQHAQRATHFQNFTPQSNFTHRADALELSEMKAEKCGYCGKSEHAGEC